MLMVNNEKFTYFGTSKSCEHYSLIVHKQFHYSINRLLCASQ